MTNAEGRTFDELHNADGITEAGIFGSYRTKRDAATHVMASGHMRYFIDSCVNVIIEAEYEMYR